MHHKMTLKQKLIIYFAGILLLALGIQAYFSYANSYRMMVEQVEASSNKSLKNMQEEIYTYINTIKQQLDTIYQEKEFISDLRLGTDEEQMKLRYREFAHDFYVDRFNSEQGIVSFYIYNTAHECISFFRFSDTPVYKYPKDIYEDEVKYNSHRVKEYLDTEDYYPLITSYYNENRECNLIRLVYKLYINNRSQVIGYFVCDVDEKVFRNIISKYTYSEEQIVCLQPVSDRTAVVYGTVQEEQEALLMEISGRMEEGDEDYIGHSISHKPYFRRDNMKKKVLSLLLSTAMIATLLVDCGGSKEAKEDSAADTVAEETADAAETETEDTAADEDAAEATETLGIGDEPVTITILAGQSTTDTGTEDMISEAVATIRSLIPKDVVLQQVNKIKTVSVWIIALLIVVSLTLGLSVSRNISKEIRDLCKVLQRVAAGDFTVRYSTKSKDEFWLLSNAIDEMLIQIRSIMERIFGFNTNVTEMSDVVAVKAAELTVSMKDIGQSSDEINNGVSMQADASEKSFEMMQRFSDRIGDTNENIGQIGSLVTNMEQKAKGGIVIIDDLKLKSKDTVELTAALLEDIKDVIKQSETITQVVESINAIAQQTIESFTKISSGWYRSLGRSTKRWLFCSRIIRKY